MVDCKTLNLAANNIRILTAAMVEKAKSGHPGGAMGGADFINVLYSKFLTYDPTDPTWINRDRFFSAENSQWMTSNLFANGRVALRDILR